MTIRIMHYNMLSLTIYIQITIDLLYRNAIKKLYIKNSNKQNYLKTSKTKQLPNLFQYTRKMETINFKYSSSDVDYARMDSMCADTIENSKYLNINKSQRFITHLNI